MAKKELKDQNKAPRSWQRETWEYTKAILVAVVLALIIRAFIVQAFQIPSGSMIPTFLEGDRVLVTKFSYGVRNPLNNNVWIETGRPERGDVIVFIYPIEPDKDFVKRVIGLPGDVVFLSDGVLYINGQPAPDDKANYDQAINYNEYRTFGPVTVPEGQYFVMGDNRDHSLDSRGWGFVDYSLLKGKAWRLYWSWDSQTPDLGFFNRIRLSRVGQAIE